MNPSFHISGHHHPIELPETDERRDEPMTLISLPRGFQTLDVAVYGHGLSYADAREAVLEYLDKYLPNALTDDEIAELHGIDPNSCEKDELPEDTDCVSAPDREETFREDVVHGESVWGF